MRKRIVVFAHQQREHFGGKHRFEHWYVDNQVYFITAKCRGAFPAFTSEESKAIFWDRFDHYTNQAGFVPWVTSLMTNHYHTLGYNRSADGLKVMMQKIHGSIAKLVNDVIGANVCPSGFEGVLNTDGRLSPFFKDSQQRDFFDGCIRDEKQCRRAYRYTLLQSVRHGIVSDYRDYAHTRVGGDLDRGVARAHELGAFMEGVPYARYAKGRAER